MKLRKVTLLFVQFPGYAGDLPDCRFRICIFLCALIRCFHQMHVLAVFRQPFIRLFHLNLQCIRQNDIAFFRAKRQLLHRNRLIQLRKSDDCRTFFLRKHRHLDAWQKAGIQFIAAAFQFRIKHIDTRCFSIVCIFLTEGLIQHPADLYFLPVFIGFRPVRIGWGCFLLSVILPYFRFFYNICLRWGCFPNCTICFR